VRSAGRSPADWLAWGTFWFMAPARGGGDPARGQCGHRHVHVLPPLKAHWSFSNVGLTMVVAGTWGVTANSRDDPPSVAAGALSDERTRCGLHVSCPFAMWTLASAGLAAEMLFMLIRWSLGMVHGTDPLLARTLFLVHGHPIVYFWLLAGLRLVVHADPA